VARPSWRSVAETLAVRLVEHAFCEQHRPDSPDPDCPHCGDRSAYGAYLKAGGRDFRPPPYTGPTVSVHDLARDHVTGAVARRRDGGGDG
jgi:hypothetical protein